MSFGNRNNNNNTPNDNQQRPGGKPEDPSKVSFSSIKLGQTKQGSPTVGLYLKREQMEKMVGLMTEMLQAGVECKIGVIVIQGRDYDSGYAYVNAKEERQQQNGNGGQGNGGQNQQRSFGGNNGGSSYRKPQGGNFGNKSQARAFLQNKRVGNGEEGGQGN